VSFSEILNLAIGTVQGVGVAAVFLLVVFIGICVLLGLYKLRASGPRTMTVRSLEESLGTAEPYLRPDAPRGASDQLRGSRPRAPVASHAPAISASGHTK
jgi:hypothetical protein